MGKSHLALILNQSICFYHLRVRLLHNTSAAFVFAGQVRFVAAFFAAFFQCYNNGIDRRKNMFGKYGIDFGPETHEGFSDREWKLACEFFNLMLQLPLRLPLHRDK